MTKMKEITPEELKERIRRNGPNVGLANVRIEGIVEIRDKDGNLKGKLKLDSEIDEETDDGTE